jgi:hypothetical protein
MALPEVVPASRGRPPAAANVVDRCKGPQGQHESALLSRQPRGCKVSLLCISLWMFSANRLVTCYVSVDERGCGKVDNGFGADHAQAGKLRLSTTAGEYPQCSL